MTKKRGRDQLPEAARQLALMVLATPGLSLEMYTRAGEVDRFTSRGKGQRGGTLTIEQTHTLFDLMDAPIREGKTQKAAVKRAKKKAPNASDRRAFEKLTERQLKNIYAKVRDSNKLATDTAGAARRVPQK
jgi:hypothetical protein